MERDAVISVPREKKHSLNKNFLEIEDEDVETEIQRRREEAINKSAEVRRRSVAVPLIAGLTASELVQHCKDCIKLSTENKINTKNAFSFLLIDAMAAMAKKADSEINKNFQVASCTLDASVKIYGYRVDAVHTEAIKMAGGVLSKEVGNEVENVGDVENDQDENELKTKIKRKKKKKLTIAPPEALNAKSENDYLINFTPYQNFLMHKNDGNELLSKIPKFNDNSILYVNSDYICWPYEENKSLVPSFKKSDIFDTAPLKSILKEIELTPNNHLSNMYHNFEFGKGQDEGSENSSDEEIPSIDEKNDFEFDLNASVEDISLSEELNTGEVETQRNRLAVPQGGFESDEEINLPAVAQKQGSQRIAISDLKNRITLNQLEYSMFDEQVMKVWAGPSYWKVCPNKKVSDDNKENDGETNAVPLKRTRKGKLIKPVSLYSVTDSELVKCLATGEKTTLNKTTMLNWSPQNVTVPKDCMYKVKNLFSLFHLPDFSIDLKKDKPVVELCEMSDNRSEVNEELEYCSNLSLIDDQMDQVSVGDAQDKADIGQFVDKDEIWDEKNMVALPQRVGKIQGSTFKRKKNVDIKQLKRCLWNLIAEPDQVGEHNDYRVNKPVAFSEIMNTYCVNFPKNLVSSLSAPLMFNALLHLTNEKCLTLTQDRLNKKDFIVSQ